MAKGRTTIVSVQGAVSLPAARVTPLVESVLQQISRAPGHISLSVDLSQDLQAPVEASLSVPIALEVSRAAREHEFAVRIASARHAHVYPSFNGTLRITPARGDSSVIILRGSYLVPFGPLGKSIDITLLRGAARSSLRRFLDYVLERLNEQAYAQT